MPEMNRPDPWTVARDEMAPGERLIWAGRPQARSRSRALPLALFGLLFATVAVFWTTHALAESGWLALAGLLFVGLGIAIAVRGLRRGTRAPEVVYAVSDRRLLIVQGWPQRRVQSFGPSDIDMLERHERADGTGDLLFRRVPKAIERGVGGDPDERRWRQSARARHIGFYRIPDVRQVENAVRALADSRRGSRNGSGS